MAAAGGQEGCGASGGCGVAVVELQGEAGIHQGIHLPVMLVVRPLQSAVAHGPHEYDGIPNTAHNCGSRSNRQQQQQRE